MSTFLMRKALINYFALCDKLHHGPYTINATTGYLEIVTNKYRIWYWYFANFVIAVFTPYFAVFLLVQLFSKTAPYGIISTIVAILLLICLVDLIFLNLPLLLSLQDSQHFFNSIFYADK